MCLCIEVDLNTCFWPRREHLFLKNMHFVRGPPSRPLGTTTTTTNDNNTNNNSNNNNDDNHNNANHNNNTNTNTTTTNNNNNDAIHSHTNNNTITNTAYLPTNIVGFRGFDSSTSLIQRGGIPRPIVNSPESLSQAMLVGVMLVGRLGVLV